MILYFAGMELLWVQKIFVQLKECSLEVIITEYNRLHLPKNLNLF